MGNANLDKESGATSVNRIGTPPEIPRAFFDPVRWPEAACTTCSTIDPNSLQLGHFPT
jgi:hypothetical protein